MRWVRFVNDGVEGFGALSGRSITPYSGDLFGVHRAGSATLRSDGVKILPPVYPGKIIGLANNFHALIEKVGGTVPLDPLYFIKANTSLNADGGDIVRPQGYDGKVIFEGELGLVIKKTCRNISPDAAMEFVLGCTCVNDVTAIGLLHKDSSFPQWTRAKAADTFGVIGPVIATDLSPALLRVETHVNGDQRQCFPVSDMVFTAEELVSRLSRDMTLEAGDIIACGTSVGVGRLRDDDVVTVTIDGIGSITNTFRDSVESK